MLLLKGSPSKWSIDTPRLVQIKDLAKRTYRSEVLLETHLSYSFSPFFTHRHILFICLMYVTEQEGVVTPTHKETHKGHFGSPG